MNKKPKVSNINEQDRISVLSDPILHHIMSFMDMKEVLKTSKLSTRWRSLWTSVPVLNFNIALWKIDRVNRKLEEKEFESRFVKFVDRVLLQHCKDSNLQRFCVSCSHYCPRDLDFWIRIAVERRIQDIYIEHNGGSTRHNILDFVFTSDIKNFKLRTAVHSLVTPSSMGLAYQLKSLELQESTIRLNASTGEVAISCPVLENLKLSNCRYTSYTLRISTPKLKSLFIEQPTSKDYCPKTLILSTQKLNSLVLKGTPFVKYIFPNIGSFVNADIQSDEPIKPQALIELLKGLCNAESLKLSCQLQQSLDEVDWCLCSFMNLRRLKIFNFSDGSCIHMVHNLLANCPRLETLIVGIDQITNKEKDFTELFHCISSLKYIEIQGVECREIEMEFFEFLLKTASALESFVVSTSNTFLRNTLEERATFQMKIHTLPRASLRVKILFQTIIKNNVVARSSKIDGPPRFRYPSQPTVAYL
ncbi:hypothetical protein ACHQM5_017592 [Ranunculus cassubicifolius]